MQSLYTVGSAKPDMMRVRTPWNGYDRLNAGPSQSDMESVYGFGIHRCVIPLVSPIWSFDNPSPAVKGVRVSYGTSELAQWNRYDRSNSTRQTTSYEIPQLYKGMASLSKFLMEATTPLSDFRLTAAKAW